MELGPVPHSRYVLHGSLRVPRSFERDYATAKAYLSQDRGEAKLFERLEHARGRHYRLVVNARDSDYFDPSNDTIGWDPHSALRTSRGGRQSPALGLGHEVDHAVESRTRERKLEATPCKRYDDAEERRVITGSERRAARTLGEAVRFDHGGTSYRVRSPVAELIG